MKSFFLLCSLLFIFSISSCGPDVNTFAKYISAESLKKHLLVIASDSMEGREMATDGERKASSFIAGEFKSFGLQQAPSLGGYYQGFEVVKDSFINGSIQLAGQLYPLEYFALSVHSPDSVVDIHSENIIFVGYGIEDKNYSDYNAVNAAGQIVACYLGEPMTDTSHYIISGNSKRSDWSVGSAQFLKRLALAKQKGAKAILFLNNDIDTLPDHKSRIRGAGQFRPNGENNNAITSFTLTKSLTKAILGLRFDEVSNLQKKRSPLENFVNHTPIGITLSKTMIYKTVNNVIGYVEGTDKKNEYVIVSAHYDHLGVHGGEIYHGADDNGSGTCGLLGIAEAFSKAAAAGKRPRRSVIFLSVTGEEKGLFGSKNYVAHPAFPLEQTVVDINTDMIGRSDFDHENKDSNYIYVIGDEKLSSELRGIDEHNNNEHTKLTLDYKYNDPDDPNKFYYRSDHYEFAQKHIPIIFYFDGVHKDYHQPSDTIEKINFQIMEKRARLAYYTAWEIANREDRLKADRNGE